MGVCFNSHVRLKSEKFWWNKWKILFSQIWTTKIWITQPMLVFFSSILCHFSLLLQIFEDWTKMPFECFFFLGFRWFEWTEINSVGYLKINWTNHAYIIWAKEFNCFDLVKAFPNKYSIPYRLNTIQLNLWTSIMHSINFIKNEINLILNMLIVLFCFFLIPFWCIIANWSLVKWALNEKNVRQSYYLKKCKNLKYRK